MLGAALDEVECRGQAFNFGSGEDVDISSLIGRIAELAGRPDVSVMPAGDSVYREIVCQRLDSSKAAYALGWRPAISLEAGLRETIDWYREFFSRQDR